MQPYTHKLGTYWNPRQWTNDSRWVSPNAFEETEKEITGCKWVAGPGSGGNGLSFRTPHRRAGLNWAITFVSLHFTSVLLLVRPGINGLSIGFTIIRSQSSGGGICPCAISSELSWNLVYLLFSSLYEHIQPMRPVYQEGDDVLARSCTKDEGCNDEDLTQRGKCNSISTAREEYDPYLSSCLHFYTYDHSRICVEPSLVSYHRDPSAAGDNRTCPYTKNKCNIMIFRSRSHKHTSWGANRPSQVAAMVNINAKYDLSLIWRHSIPQLNRFQWNMSASIVTA